MLLALRTLAVSPATTLGLSYLAAGGVVAGLLHRRGHEAATAVASLVAWPLLVPLLSKASTARPTRALPAGPAAQRIDEVFAALRRTLEPGEDDALAELSTLEELERGLRLADGRIARVERLLAEEEGAGPASPSVQAGLSQLRTARDHALGEVHAVLDELVQLRLQMGLVALAGDGLGLRSQLSALQARVSALGEVARAAR